MPSSRDLPISEDSRARRPILETRNSQSASYTPGFYTHAADRNTNGVDGLIAALEDKRIQVSLHAPGKAQSAQTFKHPTSGGNSDRPTPRPDKSLKEEKEKEKRDMREKEKVRQKKKPEPEAEG
jgi:acylphosphatase